MGKALVFVLVMFGVGAAAFYSANPELAKKTLNESKANVEKMVDDLKKKAE